LWSPRIGDGARLAAYDDVMALPPRLARALVGVVAVAGALGVATVLVAVLETSFGVRDASAAYLLAVIGLAVGLGTAQAIAGACGAFLAYNYLFVEPVRTFTVVDPTEWLNLLLLLVVGVVVGRLAGGQRRRAEAAEMREREARGLFQVGQAVASARDGSAALQGIAAIVRDETRMARVWIGLEGTSPLERVVADTGLGAAPGPVGRHAVLRRHDREASPEWVELHVGATSGRRLASADLAVHRVPIEIGGRAAGSLWALRPRPLGVPSGEETRLLAAAADQIGQALERDRLRVESTSLEVARQGDALKSALVDSVSHELRTPLATIRAAAGRLARDDQGSAAAAVIERQAEYLDRLVGNLLDLSRIEAGALRPALRPILLDDAVADTIDRLGPIASGVIVDVPASLPAILADEVHLDTILANLVENALRYAEPGCPIRIRAGALGEDRVRLTVEDGGPGVPPAALEHLFEKFYRVSSAGRGSGVGLAVVRGLAEAGGARVGARGSELGGLAVDLDLPLVVDALSTADR
jgi:two-component system sensor histidine kinase KdpD